MKLPPAGLFTNKVDVKLSVMVRAWRTRQESEASERTWSWGLSPSPSTNTKMWRTWITFIPLFLSSFTRSFQAGESWQCPAATGWIVCLKSDWHSGDCREVDAFLITSASRHIPAHPGYSLLGMGIIKICKICINYIYCCLSSEANSSLNLPIIGWTIKPLVNFTLSHLSDLVWLGLIRFFMIESLQSRRMIRPDGTRRLLHISLYLL